MTDTVPQETTDDAMLPDSWIWVTVEDIAVIASGQTPKGIKDVVSEGEFPWFRVGDMNVRGNEKYMNLAKVDLTKQEVDALRIRLQPPGTIVFPKRGGAIATNKKRILSKPSAYDLNTMGIFPLGVEHSYFWHWFMTIDLGNLSDGSNVPQINNDDIQPLKVPLPPLNEQRRIVEKIEELFTKLDAGVRSLEKTRALLKSYRRSVLKAAVEGELSREWREAHKDELESASELLERILQERREKFAGKKYKEPTAPDTPKLPALPDGWERTSLSSIADTQLGKMLSQAAKTGSGSRPYLRNQNIRWGSIETSDVLMMDFDEREVEKFTLAHGDVLVCEGGEPGRAAVWNEQLPGAMYQKALHRVRVIGNAIKPEYIVYHLRKDASEGKLNRYFTGSTIKHFTGVALARYAISLPPLEEQRIIVEEVERRLSVVDKLETTVEANLKQAGGLRQSILKQAFSGELVPQNPDDEPAGVLLARIRAERQDIKRKPGKRKANRDDKAQGRLI